MAGAKRIESADAESRLALALQYQLLTDATNFIVVHERAEGEKATDLPELQRVAQMHAAGWGGVGSVAPDCRNEFQHSRSVRPDVDVAAIVCRANPVGHQRRLTLTDSRNAGIRPPLNFGSRSARCGCRAANMWRRSSTGNTCASHAGGFPAALPICGNWASMRRILDSLAALVAGDVTEEAVVRAFLEALAPAAKQAGASRQLLRALRNQFKTEGEWAAVRAAVAAIVGAPIVAGIPTP